MSKGPKSSNAAAQLSKQLAPIHNVHTKLPISGALLADMLLVERLVAVPTKEMPLREYGNEIATVLAEHGPLSPRGVAFLILRNSGYSLQEALSLHMMDLAKRPRNRGPSKTGGRALVEQVRAESKKKKWNTAWTWLCFQADNHAEIGDFILDGVTDSGDTVRYYADQSSKVRTIKKLTFQDYWERPERSKKDRK